MKLRSILPITVGVAVIVAIGAYIYMGQQQQEQQKQKRRAFQDHPGPLLTGAVHARARADEKRVLVVDPGQRAERPRSRRQADLTRLPLGAIALPLTLRGGI